MSRWPALAVSYAADDGMVFPGWAPPALPEDEAAAAYEAGERIAVLAGEPRDPSAGLVLDRRNSRVALTLATGVPRSVVWAGRPLTQSEARWTRDGEDWWVQRRDERLLTVRRRPVGGLVWVSEFVTAQPVGGMDERDWPTFGEWTGVGSLREDDACWWAVDALDLVDADGWLLDAVEADGLDAVWRDLGRRYEALRAVGVPVAVQGKLAEPRGWRAVGRRWRRADEVDTALGPVLVVTDAMFALGAGATGDVTVTVTRGELEVGLSLPVATQRIEARRDGRPGSPTPPRPSTGAQVAVVAMLEAGEALHDAVLAAVREGAVPAGWGSLGG